MAGRSRRSSSGSLGSPRRLLGVLLEPPDRRYNRPGRDDGFTWRPNAPKMSTVVGAVVLTALGLTQTLYPVPAVDELLKRLPIVFTREHAWIALLASPSLLVLASFARGL